MLRDSITSFECNSIDPPSETWHIEIDSMECQVTEKGIIKFSELKKRVIAN